jgi:hypothetical protein
MMCVQPPAGLASGFIVACEVGPLVTRSDRKAHWNLRQGDTVLEVSMSRSLS